MLWEGDSDDSSAPSRDVKDAEGTCRLAYMGGALATLVGGDAKDYLVTRVPPPIIAISYGGQALVPIVAERL